MSYIRRKIKKLFKRSVKKKDLVRLREGILEYYDKNGLPDDDPDLKSAVAYIRDKGTKAFPYAFGDKYDDMQVEVFKDPECGLRYVLHGGRRLYFVKGWGDRRVRHTYAALLREQDPDSPHCYQQADLGVEDGDTLFDIGCAEALLTLMVVDKVKAAYLFEGDPRWIEPLRRTFEPWKEKVTIVDKFVSDKDTPTSVTIRQDHRARRSGGALVPEAGCGGGGKGGHRRYVGGDRVVSRRYRCGGVYLPQPE